MATQHERKGGGRGRLIGLGLLAGIVALVIAYLRGCIPGLGLGGGDGDSAAPTSEQKAKAGEQTAKAASSEAIALTVDGERCRRGDEPLQPCEKLCRALGTESKHKRVEVDGTLGTHAAVETLRKCLAIHGFRDVVVRAE
jgi:hypothetical protein